MDRPDSTDPRCEKQHYPETQAVSVQAELETLGDALAAVGILGDALRHREFSTAYAEKKAPHAISAVVSLVAQRLKLLEYAVAGAADPAVLLAPHNVVLLGSEPDEDVLLYWPADRRLEHARQELHRAERQAADAGDPEAE